MATDVTRREMILAYDGDCPMCLSIVGLLARAGLVTPEQLVSHHDLSPGDLERAQAAGIRNQLVVLDRLSQEARGGADGLLWIVGENRAYPLWIRLLSLPGVRHLIGLGYETISYNRRVVSPPPRQIRCDCEPEVTLARRLMLIVPLSVLAVVFLALFGGAVFVGWKLGDAAAGILFMEVAAGSGWIALLAGALVLLRGEQRVDYIAHLVVTAFVGALVLVPAGLMAWWLPPVANVLLASVSVFVSLVLMLGMQRRRVAAVGLHSGWLWGWIAAVAIGFVGTKLVYFGAGMLP